MKNYVSIELKKFNNLISEIDAVYHDVAVKFGLSDSAMLILYTICNYGENCLLNDICKSSGISKQTINSSIRKLENDGIVYLKLYNGRKKEVHLTERGKELAENTVMRVMKIESEIFDSWNDDERSAYIELTKRFLFSFREKADKL